MFEDVGHLRGQTSLEDQFCFDEAIQLPLQGRIIELRNGVEQRIRKLPPDDGGVLGHGIGSAQRIQPCHE